MRQIVLDTETTGIGHDKGHRIIEIGCVEMVDRQLTGKHFHVYLNPERAVDEGAYKVHGISNEFLLDKPRFSEIASGLIDFIKDSELIIHNAPFDVGFLNAEFSRIKHPHTLDKYCTVFDTLVLAKKKHPGQKNNLDALCKRYDVDNSNRDLHGALLDAEILALVYLAMTGGQGSLFDLDLNKESNSQTLETTYATGSRIELPVLKANTTELAAHQIFIEKMIKKTGINLWQE